MATTKQATVTVTGDVRVGGAIVDTTSVDLTRDGKGDLSGSADVTVSDPVAVAVNLAGKKGAAFTLAVAIHGHGSASRTGRITTGVAIRSWEIPLREFK